MSAHPMSSELRAAFCRWDTEQHDYETKHACANELDRLHAREAALVALVEAAYREGWGEGRALETHREPGSMSPDCDWSYSRAKAAIDSAGGAG